MLHRSRLRRSVALIAALSASALAAAPVHAAPAPVPVPADAPTVATTASGDAVIAFVIGGRTCTVLQKVGAPRPTTLVDDDATAQRGSVEANGSCDAVRAQSRFHAETLGSRADAERRLVWGVAGAGAARLQLRDGSRVVSESAAAPAALPGPSGALRFWVLEQPDGDRADEVALLDAGGTVRNAWTPVVLGLGAFMLSGDLASGSAKVLAHGRAGDTRWRLLLDSEPRLAPTPLDPERRVPVRCLGFASESGRSGGSSDFGGLCDQDALEVTALAATSGSSCDIGLHFEVLARSSVRSAVAILGDGSRRRIRLLALGGALEARGGALIVGAGVAVRRIDGLGADGRVVGTWPVKAPPYRPDCGLSTSGSVFFDDLTVPTALGAPPHVVHVADHGDQLCVALDRAPRPPAECAVPPTEPESAGVGSVAAGAGTYVYGIVPTEVAAARVRFADGTTRTVATTPIPGYSGQYAGVLGQIALDVPAGADARSAALLDATGRVVGRSDLRTLRLSQGRTTTLRPASDGVPAFLATPFTIDLPGHRETATCVAFSVPRTLFGCGLDLFGADDTGARTVRVLSRCAPRRLVVSAVLRRAADRLVVRTRAGRDVVARAVRVPAAAGGAAGHHLAVAVLGPREAVAGVRLRGTGARKVKAAYPPAASQCGYDDQPGLG
jgi:hypothetical protein